MIVVETRELGRKFDSKGTSITALENVNLEVNEGEVFGLLGPNGAGKTTLIRILSTLLLPSGTATIAGYDVASETEAIRPLINMASGSERAGYEFITVRRNMWFLSQLYGISTEDFKQRISTLSSQLELNAYLDKKVYALSTGYRQRITIAWAFINERAALISDSWTLYVNSMAFLALGGIFLLAIGIVAFSYAERSARAKGFIDKKVM